MSDNAMENKTSQSILGDKDSMLNTFVIAGGVCLVCSLLVSAAAVGLRSLQEQNRVLDVKKNIVNVAGFTEQEIDDAGGIAEIYKDRIEAIIINLETGEEASEELMNARDEFTDLETTLRDYDQFKERKSSDLSVSVEDKVASSSIGGSREKYSFVYLQKDADGNVTKYIFPIRGRGLWSTLKGFISLETDFQTVGGITYYEHGETPGLGGEVDNPNWKAKWVGKKVYADDGNVNSEGEMPSVELTVVKGSASDEFGVDGLAGATITANGVTNMIQYWMGDEGFGPFIARQKQQLAGGQNNDNSNGEGNSDG